MRHFEFLEPADRERLFHLPPDSFDIDADPTVRAMALGATLYSPATRPRLAADLVAARTHGVLSSVACLEDAIPDDVVDSAQSHLLEQLRCLSERPTSVPWIFVRVRRPEQITQIAEGLTGSDRALVGFVLPKFESGRGEEFLHAVECAANRLGRELWSMPVIETAAVMHRESRQAELLSIRALLERYRHQVIAVRVGATDLASVYGLRRPRELTVYDVHLVADAIADIVNVLGRIGRDGFAVSGPVWEFFTANERLFKPQLRTTPFNSQEDSALRARLIARDLDGSIREVVLDRANGLTGKTVIHPTHVRVVHALSVVSHEEHVDAERILSVAKSGGGVAASAYGNKMNEASPHRTWAQLTQQRGGVFGVSDEGVTFVDLLAACVRA
jgi:citrate lyase beta subunit